jgi:hypothetical protein
MVMGGGRALNALPAQSSIRFLNALCALAPTTQRISILTTREMPMDIQQLELPFWSQLQSARLAPEAINLEAMLDQAESAIAHLPESQQMQAAGEAILQFAQLCSLRSEVLIDNWENSYRDPHVANSFFSDIVRQTMAVDLSDLIEPPPPRVHRRLKSNAKVESSVAGVVDRSVVLTMMEQMEAESQASELPMSDEQKKQLALASAHDEDISAWSQEIAHQMQHSGSKPVSLLQLQQALGMPLIEVWLGLLLGEQKQYQWEIGEEFYNEVGEIRLISRIA